MAMPRENGAPLARCRSNSVLHRTSTSAGAEQYPRFTGLGGYRAAAYRSVTEYRRAWRRLGFSRPWAAFRVRVGLGRIHRLGLFLPLWWRSEGAGENHRGQRLWRTRRL